MRARAALLLFAAAAATPACRREGTATVEQQQAEIERLQKERDELRAKLGEMIMKDARLQGMPTNTVRVGVPTTLARTLIEKVLGGVADQVELRLSNIKVRK